MNTITPNLNSMSNTPLYVQLYEYIKHEILDSRIAPNEKLPSIRGLSKELNLSKTTVESSYDQLLVEGYIYSKPQSGYYANTISKGMAASSKNQVSCPDISFMADNDQNKFTDVSSFDFVKWKKCLNQVLTNHTDSLLVEAAPQGEKALRNEIAKYVYQSRGAVCTPEQIVIGAGTQQIMNLLCTILENIGIRNIAFEDPGYYPARKTFSDRDFNISPVPVEKDGIHMEELKNSACSIVYVSPSHQFPLGSVMPIAKRYELLEWAYAANGIIIEDDYDSELRYYGRPIPSLQGLDQKDRVIYLGSFSTTLLPSIKISYIMLPDTLLKYYRHMMYHYNQTCSKIEQLTLALYMKEGFYQKQIKKLRKLYTNKIQLLVECIQKEMKGLVKVLSHTSGLHILLEIHSGKSVEKLCEEAATLKLDAVPIEKYIIRKREKGNPVILLYYTQIPLSDIPMAVHQLKNIWDK